MGARSQLAPGGPEDRSESTYGTLPLAGADEILGDSQEFAELLDRPFRLVDVRPWERSEYIPVLEGRAVNWTVRRFCRKVSNHGEKHIILSDVCRSVAAHVLAAVLKIRLR